MCGTGFSVTWPPRAAVSSPCHYCRKRVRRFVAGGGKKKANVPDKCVDDIFGLMSTCGSGGSKRAQTG